MECNCCKTLNKKDVSKEQRGAVIPSCGGCGMLAQRGSGVVLKVCSRCKFATYCSQKCQRKSWSYHKQECSVEENKGLTYFTQKIFNSPLIRHYLELALIYEFGLHKATPSESTEPSRTPLNAYMDLIIEPRDLRQREALFEQQVYWNHEGVEGVVLINAIFDASKRASPPAFSESALRMVRNVLPDSHIVVLNIRHHSHYISTYVLGLRPHMIKIARENNFSFERIGFPLHAINGPSVPLQRIYNPSSIDGPGTPYMHTDVCNMVNHINRHIRCDENNDIKLCTTMTKRDKKALLACIWDPTSPGAIPTGKTIYSTSSTWQEVHRKAARAIE